MEIKVKFIGGSKDGLETVANLKMSPGSGVDLIATFGEESYKFDPSNNTFVLVKP